MLNDPPKMVHRSTGNDGSSTYYIDMVDRKFARSSTASFDKRYDLLDSVDDMFEKIVNEN